MYDNFRLQQHQQSVFRVSEWAACHPSASITSAVGEREPVPGVPSRGQSSCAVPVVPQHSTLETTQDTFVQGKGVQEKF